METNKYEEALLYFYVNSNDDNFKRLKDNKEILQELVDKAEPKKFKQINRYEFECPTCKKVYDHNKVDYDYCPNCSQKIDWSDFV